jgi:hypothetical protein
MNELQYMNLSRVLRLQRETIDKNTDAINRLADAVEMLSKSKENMNATTVNM